MCESKRQGTEMWPQLERIRDILRLVGRMASSLSDELDYTGFNAPAVQKIADTFAELFASSARELREISKAIAMEIPTEADTGFEGLPRRFLSLTLEEVSAKFNTLEELGQYIQMLKDLRDAEERDRALRDRRLDQKLEAFVRTRCLFVQEAVTKEREAYENFLEFAGLEAAEVSITRFSRRIKRKFSDKMRGEVVPINGSPQPCLSGLELRVMPIDTIPQPKASRQERLRGPALLHAISGYTESQQAELKQDPASEGCSLPDSHRTQDNGQAPH